jgi:hypothetical protein
MPSFGERLKNSWNAFMGRDPTENSRYVYRDYGGGSGLRPDRMRFSRGNERTFITSLYSRIAMDCASIKIEHVRCDENGNYRETIKSHLNNCLTLEANLDQIAPAFIQDVCMSMFDEGVVAIVPTHATDDPSVTESYDVGEMRTAKIIEWFPYYVRLELYNEATGKKVQIVLPKSQVAIIENPLYAVMNEPNSTLQRLIRTLNNIDKTNEQAASGKLDLIIQLPYSIRSQARQEQAESRRKQIEAQLVGSKYGIAYIDSTEHVTQLNRAVENNLWTQATDLRTQIFEQLGLSQSILDGTADEKTMINYYNRTIDPILDAITKEMKRKFLSITARSQGQDIQYFRDPFKLVPAAELADISDKLRRNEILSANEVRAEIGYKPVTDPKADALSNPNVSQSADIPPVMTQEGAGNFDGNLENIGAQAAQQILAQTSDKI